MLILLLLSQDLASDWMDRVSHDLLQSKGPLPTRPLHHTLHMGLLSLYESNVNLEEDDEDGESILTPFLRLRLEYSERQLDAAADVLANYKYYIPDHEHSDEEERVYGRVRFVSPKMELEAAEIFQHVSDPVDVVFADRVDRFVSDTIGRARVEATPGFALEADVAFGLVRFQEKEFDEGDNWNLRAGAGLALRVSNVMEAVAQAGFLFIDYRYDTGAAPDVDGAWVRGGLRGDLLPTLSVTALLGAARAESEDFESGAEGVEDETGEAALHLRWQASAKLTLYGDYSRMIAFGAAPEPYQVVDRFTALAEIEANQDVRLRIRAQWDHADGALGLERDWASVGAAVQWQTHAQVFFDAGFQYRWGSSDGAPADADYEDAIVHLGIVVTN